MYTSISDFQTPISEELLQETPRCDKSYAYGAVLNKQFILEAFHKENNRDLTAVCEDVADRMIE